MPPRAEPRGTRFVWITYLGLTALWAAAMIQRGEPLAWDEVEFFRATRWIAEGRVPFRDFWEHHMPLQWLVFAPAARLWGGGAGASAVVALRWAQVPAWIAILAIVWAICRRAGSEAWGRWAAVVCLLASPWFARAALQYRVDVLGHLGYFAALLLIVSGRVSVSANLFAGALFAAGVLSNMRLAPLVLVTTAVALMWRVEERRWSWNPRGLWIIAGGAAVAALFFLYLVGAHALPGFIEGVIRYNRVSNSLVPSEARSFWMRILEPVFARDLAACVLIVAGVAASVLSLREMRRPGIEQIVGLLALGSFAAIGLTKVQYQYHFETSMLLLVPPVAMIAGRLQNRRWKVLAMLAVGVAIALDLVALAAPAWGEAMEYQNRVMVEADRRTAATERVWDGCGYALRREPAYKYWFLPAGVRLMSDAGLIEPYDVEQMAGNPPAAIVFNLRTRFWMSGRPRLRAYATHHYVPLYQNLWIPGMSGLLDNGDTAYWVVPASGRYEAYVSEMLAKHPWFTRPLDYAVMEGTELEIPLERVDVVPPDRIDWRVNGKQWTPQPAVLELHAGERLDLHSRFPRRVGVVLVPAGVRTLSLMPDAPLVF